MSRGLTLGLAIALTALVPVASLAQEKKEEPKPYIYATYLECDPAGEWRADEVVETVLAPIYDAAVEEGAITGWGWMAHHTGGSWRRLLYRVAPTMEAVLDSVEGLAAKAEEKNAPASREIGRICPTHVDYIWRRVTGSEGEGRGKAGFSVYHVCDMTEEKRADEIVETVLGPLYNEHVGEGKLDSWAWHSHVVGGKWRRLATMSAADHKTILKVRAKIIEELSAKHEAATSEFSSICSMHEDYMWEIKLETP